MLFEIDKIWFLLHSSTEILQADGMKQNDMAPQTRARLINCKKKKIDEGKISTYSNIVLV